MAAHFWGKTALLFFVVGLPLLSWWLVNRVFIDVEAEQVAVILYLVGPVAMSIYLAFLVLRSGIVAKLITGTLALGMLLPSPIHYWQESSIKTGCQISAAATANGGYVDPYSVLACQIGYDILAAIAIVIAYVCSILFALILVVHDRLMAEIHEKEKRV